MVKFQYLEPKTLKEACDLLAQYGQEAKAIAGGVALLVLMKQGLASPRYLVSLTSIPGLDYIDYDEKSGLRIGGLTSHAAIDTSLLIRERFPLIAETFHKIGSPRIRNMGTIGGNLCHADPREDPATTLMALGARVKLVGSKGERVVPLEELFVDYFQTALHADEILTEVQVPNPAPRTGGAHFKFTPNTDQDFATVGGTVVVTLGQADLCRDIRIVLNAVAPTVIRARESEAAVRGKKLGEDVLEQAAQMAATEAEPVSDVRGSAEYKREMVKVFVKRAARKAAALALGIDPAISSPSKT